MNLIIPMEPILREEIFDSSDFTYQLKWDGVRMLTYVSGGKVELFNKRLHNRSDQYPELQLFSSLFKKNKVILDGEIIAFKDSKPNFPAVMRRDNARNKQRIQLLMQEVPINYIVFDLLWYEDEDLRVLSWEQRQQRLKELLKPQAMIHIIEDFPSGSSLFNAVKKAELEGVVAKRKASRYQDGKKHRDYPDFLVFDLDPSPGNTFAQVRQIALLTRQVLHELGLRSYVKTSGSEGLHIYLPLVNEYTYSQVRDFAQAVANIICTVLPDIATVERMVKKRGAKVYVDYLQNVKGKTLCSVYSVRPRHGATVSTPIHWEEVNIINPGDFNIKTVIPRLKKEGELFAPVLTDRQSLDNAARQLGLKLNNRHR